MRLTFLIALTEIKLRKNTLVCLMAGTVRQQRRHERVHGRREHAAMTSYTRSREMNASGQVTFLRTFTPLIHVTVSSTFRVGLLSTVKHLWKDIPRIASSR